MKNGRIIFLEVPKSLGEDIKKFSAENSDAETFEIDTAIPLPVELDTDGNSETIDIKNLSDKLSWEMILSGMIQVVSSEKKTNDEDSAAEGSIPEIVKPHWINYYRRFVLLLKPEIYNEFTNAAVIKTKNRDFDAAMEIIEALEGLFPFSAEVLLNKALVQEEEASELEKKGCEMEAALENEKAFETYRKALDTEPLLPELLYNLGFFCARQKEFAKAREYFSEYLSHADDPEKKKRAEGIVREIENSGLDDYKYSKSLELIRLGKEEEALLLIRDFIEEHPGVWNAWFILGWALRKQGRWDDALASLRKALELGGTAADTRNEAAICLMELGDYAGARKELESALREEPENVKIISNLGMLALKKGNEKEASGFFRTVLELNPQDPLALKYFAENN